MKLSGRARVLAVTLGLYVVCDILLTPPTRLETRDPAKVTGLGYAVLGLLFLGLALAIVAIETVEWVQAALAVIAIGLGFWILQRGAAPTTT